MCILYLFRGNCYTKMVEQSYTPLTPIREQLGKSTYEVIRKPETLQRLLPRNFIVHVARYDKSLSSRSSVNVRARISCLYRHNTREYSIVVSNALILKCMTSSLIAISQDSCTSNSIFVVYETSSHEHI